MANPFVNQVEKFALPLQPLVTASVANSAHTSSPATDTLSPVLMDSATAAKFNFGVLRVRTRAVSAAATTSLTVNITDGTTTETVAVIAATPAGIAIETIIPIVSDLNISSVALVWTIAGTIGTGITVDAELFGN